MGDVCGTMRSAATTSAATTMGRGRERYDDED